MDPVALVIQAIFFLLFAVAVWRWSHRRGPVELGIVAIFGATAALFLLSFISTFAPDWTAFFRPVGLATLVAQPWLIVRLLALIQDVPRWANRFAFGGFLGITAGLLLLGPRSVPAILALVAYFAIVETAAAIQFLRLAGRRRGIHRVRLTLAAIATALFGVAIVVSGVGSAANNGAGSSPIVQVVGRGAALLAALGYLGAFLPPRWLTAFFHRAAAFDLARRVVTVRPGQGSAALWRELATAAEGILGASRIELLDPDGRPIAAEPADAPAAIDATTGGGSDIVVPLVIDGRRVATLAAHLDGRPLFVEDDVAIVSLLGSITARAVQHDDDMGRLHATEQALEESAALRASEARFRVFLEADPNAILAADETGHVTWATRSSTELFGYPDGQLPGRSLGELVDLADEERVGQLVEADEIRRFETTAWRADGSTLPVEVALRRIDLAGRPTTVAIVADASWREEANAIRERFVGILSHELRTPITSIYGGAQVLLKRGAELDPDARHELLTGLADESERLQRMIENLLILDRVERGADFFGPRPVLVQRVLADVVEHERGLWPSVSIDVKVDGGLPVATGDDDQLSQIMRNLLSNAVKYAGEQARIAVRASFEEPWVRVTVTDDGPGFPPEEAERLFRLYYRAAGGRAAPGAGIGLYVCRSLVEAMGGTIWARSLPEGGAEFGFTLAVHDDVEDVGPGSSEEPSRDQSAPGPPSGEARDAMPWVAAAS
ncbi:MAG TPA: ATP-binding protein [Candidatus Limnocylindrales bacterium]